LDEYSKVKLFEYLLQWRFPKVVPMGAIVIRTRFDEGTEYKYDHLCTVLWIYDYTIFCAIFFIHFKIQGRIIFGRTVLFLNSIPLVSTSADSVPSSNLVRITIAPIGTTFGNLHWKFVIGHF
jgi:hypothetical protein